jgi:outer membrane cobalamin receptor
VEARPTAWSRVHATAANLLDAAYRTEAGYPDPGREVWVGVDLEWGGDRRPEEG